MKKRISLNLLIAAMILVAFSSCKGNTPDVKKKVTGVKLSETTKTILVGDEFTLTATVEPTDAADKTVVWTSDKPTIATVTDGKVKGVAEGEANITVTTKDGSQKATCKVKVDKKAKAVVLDIQVTDITAGNAKIKIVPSDKEVKYYVYAMPKEKFEQESKKDPSLGIFAHEKSWYTVVADHSPGGKSWQDFMANDLIQGDKSLNLYDFVYFPRPNSECVVYCYGIDLKGTDDDKPSTEVFTKTIKMADAVKSSNNITVKINSTTPKGVNATFTTTNNDTYFVGIGRKKFVDFYKNHTKYNFVDMLYKMLEDAYIADHKVDLLSGNQTITPDKYSCKAGEDYYLVYCSFNRETGIGGEVKVEPFSTPKK